jgi:SAM-dependent methyltransferase
MSFMTTVFGPNYAGSYDIIYREKNYADEVDLIERLLAKHGAVGQRDILDLGCGTGNHTLPLARRGHRLTGVDRSFAMLAQARDKVAEANLPAELVPTFVECDIRQLDLGRRFDVALMMFTVLGYQHENADLVSSLAALRRHLHPEGLFIFDVWNGLSVLAQRPSDRIVEASLGGTRIVRKTSARLDSLRQICRVHFAMERTDAAGDITAWEEDHVVRYFFPQELDLALRCSGLRLLHLSSFPDGEGPPDERAWNIIGVAQAG